MQSSQSMYNLASHTMSGTPPPNFVPSHLRGSGYGGGGGGGGAVPNSPLARDVYTASHYGGGGGGYHDDATSSAINDTFDGRRSAMKKSASTVGRFGGASFGTPRRDNNNVGSGGASHHHPSLHRHTSRGGSGGGGNSLNASTLGATTGHDDASASNAIDDAPPMSSIYDFAPGGSAQHQQSHHGGPGRPQSSAMQAPTAYAGNRSLTHSMSVASGLNSRYDRSRGAGARYTPFGNASQQQHQSPYHQQQQQGAAVIVFGFPDRLTSTVVAHFNRFGRILEYADASGRSSSDLSSRGGFDGAADDDVAGEHSHSPSASAANRRSVGHNWLKLTYTDHGAASRAVVANGTLIGDRYMVGCVWVDQHAAGQYDGQSQSLYSGSSAAAGGSGSSPGRHLPSSPYGSSGAGAGAGMDDAMDIDPKTPPRHFAPGQYAQSPQGHYQTPPSQPHAGAGGANSVAVGSARAGDDRGAFKTPTTRFVGAYPGSGPDNVNAGATAVGTPGGQGRKIEILASDGIYRHPASPDNPRSGGGGVAGHAAAGAASGGVGGMVASASTRWLSSWLSNPTDQHDSAGGFAAASSGAGVNGEAKIQGTPIKPASAGSATSGSGSGSTTAQDGASTNRPKSAPSLAGRLVRGLVDTIFGF